MSDQMNEPLALGGFLLAVLVAGKHKHGEESTKTGSERDLGCYRAVSQPLVSFSRSLFLSFGFPHYRRHQRCRFTS